MSALSTCLYTVIALFMALSASCQQVEAQSELYNLRHGVLIVRLDMQVNKLAYLDEKIASTAVSDEAKAKYSLKRETLAGERALYKRNMQLAFDNYYDFSNVCFVESGDFRDYLYQQDLSVLDCAEPIADGLEPANQFIAIKGNRDNQLLIKRHDLSAVRGFQSKHGVGFRNFWQWILGDPEYDQETLDIMVGKMNKRLLKGM